MKTVITSSDAPAPIGPFSPGLRVGDLIFLSGQGGFEPSTGELVGDDIADQTDQALRNVASVLSAAGADLGDVVCCLVHLTDLANFTRFNEAYERHFPGVKPVRTTVRADLVADMLVEITAIASLHERGTSAGPTTAPDH